jgi:NADPH:quinone reductase-like Zn-dependent oxidoreductase
MRLERVAQRAIGAEPVRKVIRLDRAAIPARMKAAGNPVTDLDPRHPLIGTVIGAAVALVLDGMLAEYAVLNEEALVHVPSHHSFES